MYNRLIILSLLILHSLTAYCQITKTDKGLIITREFAEFVALRFDSLNTYKEAHRQCNEVLDFSLVIINSQDTLSAQVNKKVLSLQSEITTQAQIIESYKRTEIVTTDIQKQLRKETRKRKLWQVVGIGTGAGLLTTILILAL